MNLKTHIEWFEDYAAEKIAGARRDSSPLTLKLEHTRRVLDNARTIASKESFTPLSLHACELAALYHDLARFDQYLQFGTFRDSQSRNHGLWAVKLLKQYQRMEGIESGVAAMALAAIGVHNRALIPAGLKGMTLQICQVLRDADKIDIVMVMDSHLSRPGPYNSTVILGLPDNPELHSPQVTGNVMQGKSAFYSELRSVNDFRVLLAGWYFDMHFAASRELFIKNGNALSLLQALPENRHYAPVKEYLHGILKGIKETGV